MQLFLKISIIYQHYGGKFYIYMHTDSYKCLSFEAFLIIICGINFKCASYLLETYMAWVASPYLRLIYSPYLVFAVTVRLVFVG